MSWLTPSIVVLVLPVLLAVASHIDDLALCACTGKKVAELMKLFQRHAWEDLHIPEELRTARAWHLALRRGIAEYDEFEHIDVAAECGIEGECLILSVQRDLAGTLPRMITEGPGSLPG